MTQIKQVHYRVTVSLTDDADAPKEDDMASILADEYEETGVVDVDVNREHEEIA